MRPMFCLLFIIDDISMADNSSFFVFYSDIPA